MTSRICSHAPSAAAALVRRGQAGFGAQAWLLRRALDAAATAPVLGADARADVVAAIEASAAFLRRK